MLCNEGHHCLVCAAHVNLTELRIRRFAVGNRKSVRAFEHLGNMYKEESIGIGMLDLVGEMEGKDMLSADYNLRIEEAK